MTNLQDTYPIHILIAEDQEADRLFLEKAFNSLETETIISWAKDGQEVIDSLSSNNTTLPNLMILDMKMPRKDGLEILNAIKSDDALKSIPVLIMSGSNTMIDIQNAYAQLANAYISKANSFDDMLEIAKSIEKFWFKCAQLPQSS